MLLPIGQLLEDRAKPLCVQQTAHIQEALRIMLQNDVSQLPVLDADGDIIGMISHKTIAHAVFLMADKVPLLGIAVDHCLERVETLTLEDDIFEACDLLSNGHGSIVVVDNRKPVGIITTGDMMTFFRDRSEDFIKIEDIEVTLRLRTRDAFPVDSEMKQAILAALGPASEGQTRPRRSFEELSLAELVQVMTHEDNWPRFNGMFEPLQLFKLLMERVRRVRNLLAHFRGHADLLQDRTLKYAIDWLAMRASPPLIVDGPQRLYVTDVDAPPQPGGKRWNVLRDWLKAQKPNPQGILVSFNDIQALLGGPLPSSALKHASWWSNKSFDEAQTQAWLDANWEVVKVDFRLKEAVFQPRQMPPRAVEPHPPAAKLDIAVEADAEGGMKVKSEVKK